MLDEVRMLVRDVLLHERSSFEQLLTSLASELPLVFLLDVLLASLAELFIIALAQVIPRIHPVTVD